MRIGRPERFTWLRAAGEIAVTFAFLAALARLPIGDTYTLYFAGPLLLTAGAALLLGERVGPRRWAAVLVGFLGVLVVLGLPQEWQAASLIALLAAVLSVARDLITRWIPAAVGSGTVAAVTGAGVALSGWATALGGDWVRLAWHDVGLCALAAFGVAGGYTAFVVALRTGELSYVATFRYAGIPMAMLLGLLVWGDVPSPRMLAGAALIMGAGLYIVSASAPWPVDLQQEVARLELLRPGADDEGEVGVEVAVDVAADQEIAVGGGLDSAAGRHG